MKHQYSALSDFILQTWSSIKPSKQDKNIATNTNGYYCAIFITCKAWCYMLYMHCLLQSPQLCETGVLDIIFILWIKELR